MKHPKNVRAIGARSRAQALCAARAVFECRLLVGMRLKGLPLNKASIDRDLYELERALYRVAEITRRK